MTVISMNDYRFVLRIFLTVLCCLAFGCGCGNGEKELLQAGIGKFRDGDFEAAATLLELGVESDPDSASLHCNLGLAYWKLQQTNRAIREFKIADRLSGGDERPLEFLAEIHIAEGNMDEARRVLEIAAHRTPLSARILTAQAVVARYSGEPEQARTFLESALELNSGYLPAIFNMGLLFSGPLPNKKLAERYLTAFIRIAPDGTQKDRARKLMGIKPVTGSERKSPPPPESKPVMPVREEPAVDPAEATLRQARKAIESQELDTALILLSRCVKQYPQSADALWLLASLYDRNLSYDEKARELYQEFGRRFPDDPRAKSMKQSQPEPTVVPVVPEKEVSNRPHDAPEAAHIALRRGVHFYQAHEFQNAIAAYKEALDLEAGNTDALYNLGLAYQASDQPDKAREVLKKALKHDPEMGAARYMLAVVYRDMGKHDDAIEQLDMVLERDPHYSKAYLLLGLIYREQERNDEARRYIQRYINMEPDARSVEELKEWLQSLD